jgi:thioredoxin reductase
VKVPGYGKLPVREILKEDLIALWEDIVSSTGLEVRNGEAVTGVERLDDGHFRVTSSKATYRARRVILAIGRRGVPRKLDVPGEDAPWVSYALREPEAYADDHIVVVGGGDSAVEAALALSEQPGNDVRLSYRGEGFSRIKPGNLKRVEEAVARGALEVLWKTTPSEIRPGRVVLEGSAEPDPLEVPADQVFVFIGGELPTPFLRACGVEIETKFGTP